ncbi:peptidase M15B and M15C, D,D-carboxypeptidase VanY/endolysin [Richelia sinica FACHB-800]|uniref:Peptidase M15B and M15C, D,D-carboxypeptidase VanY/endolysin n=1 Tax=Richelia sinica FACHB-800 TaxID=1357546 RepID=A0A975T6B8_9NOST|nr:D-alanyl-D-alanine carboxypeptidase family protein [Richelia sinica FACHB-800]QXE22277.1 peptidase M15B and M15C, D,D-carboxypeptidase VanY/endolysin [Richelia sinica FACHB-800]
MAIFTKKIIFLTVVILSTIILIIVHNITHQKPVNKALATHSTNTQVIKVVKPFIPNQQLDEQQRFLKTVAHRLTIVPQNNSFEYTLLKAYGAIFINQAADIKLPTKVLFTDAQEIKAFQSTLTRAKVTGTSDCYLQKNAADALNKARELVNIPLKSGYIGDCTRDFDMNFRFWRKYANNHTLEQVKQGKETKILGTVAPPGTSQHLWGLAIDLRVSTSAQRQTLNQHGWFQTVENDAPHWTYLGWTEENLAKFGLKNKVVNGITYWLTPLL